MSNRVSGNILIVDSGMGNALAINTSTGNYANYRVVAIAFWSASTLGDMLITMNDTRDTVIRFNFIAHVSGGVAVHQVISNPQYVAIGNGINLGDVKIPIATACTGWLYLG